MSNAWSRVTLAELIEEVGTDAVHGGLLHHAFAGQSARFRS